MVPRSFNIGFILCCAFGSGCFFWCALIYVETLANKYWFVLISCRSFDFCAPVSPQVSSSMQRLRCVGAASLRWNTTVHKVVAVCGILQYNTHRASHTYVAVRGTCKCTRSKRALVESIINNVRGGIFLQSRAKPFCFDKRKPECTVIYTHRKHIYHTLLNSTAIPYIWGFWADCLATQRASEHMQCKSS